MQTFKLESDEKEGGFEVNTCFNSFPPILMASGFVIFFLLRNLEHTRHRQYTTKISKTNDRTKAMTDRMIG